MKNNILVNDRFRAARGGYSRLLEIRYRECDHLVTNYQKDGPGALRRLYLDRVRTPIKKEKILRCKNCEEILGTLIVYEKEKRKAYRLYQDAVVKRITKVS